MDELNALPDQRTADPEERASLREAGLALERMLDALPPDYRVVFLLRESQGLSTSDVAAAVGVSEDVVKTRLSRVKAMLRTAIAHDPSAAAMHAYAFDGERCDRLVRAVHERLAGVDVARPDVTAPPSRLGAFVMNRKLWMIAAASTGALALLFACRSVPADVTTDPAVRSQSAPRGEWEDKVTDNGEEQLAAGKKIFRWDTFGSEAFWGGQLRLHEAIVGEKHGGVGPGLTPRQALQLGLKVDVGAVPKLLVEVLQEGAVSLDDPDTTLELVRAGAVVGVKGVFDAKDNVTSVGITCALCHSTVDDSFTKGIGRRLDGWPNRDLDVGKVVALAPNLQPIADQLGVDTATVKKVLLSWGPGKYDAQLLLDGKAFRPDGKSAAVVLPPAFGLAGVNLATYTGFGSVPYWNAYVANTQMHGRGSMVDARLLDAGRHPLGARLLPRKAGIEAAGNDNSAAPDDVTAKLAALHLYQLALPAPVPPKSSFDADRAARGAQVFAGKAGCARCHVPPLFTEPGHGLHTAAEIGIDDFQASRSPSGMYRTTPLRGLFTRAKGGFYHDGRFADLSAVVRHYEGAHQLALSDGERGDLVEYLKSL